MDNFSTPKAATLPPSFLMTPPHSSVYLSPPPQLILVSSFITPPKEEPNLYGDIVSMLHKSGCPHLSKAIFSHLQPADLASCMCTNRTWRMLIQESTNLLESVGQYQLKQRENVENLYNQTFRTSHYAPLTDLTNYPSSSSKPITIPDEPQMSCNSYSPVNVDNRSLLCSNCNCIFCTGCLQSVHTTDFSSHLGSRKIPCCSEAVAGSKTSKRRLKRL